MLKRLLNLLVCTERACSLEQREGAGAGRGALPNGHGLGRAWLLQKPLSLFNDAKLHLPLLLNQIVLVLEASGLQCFLQKPKGYGVRLHTQL